MGGLRRGRYKDADAEWESEWVCRECWGPQL